jgi:hypothetical protein
MFKSSFTYLALYFGQQPLSKFGALRIMPANIGILYNLHLLPHFVPSRLNQHVAQTSGIIARQKVIQVEVEKVAIGKVVSPKIREVDGIQVVLVTEKGMSVVEAIDTASSSSKLLMRAEIAVSSKAG